MEYSGNSAIIGTVGAGIGGLVVGSGLGYLAGKRSNRKKSKSRKKSKGRVSRKRNNRNKSRRYTPHTAGKRKDTSHRRIRYTKKGQPYIIQGNGKARFISMKSAKQSHKRKGGKY